MIFFTSRDTKTSGLSWTFHLNESGLCISGPDEDHLVDQKYLFEYVFTKDILFPFTLVSAFVFLHLM